MATAVPSPGAAPATPAAAPTPGQQTQETPQEPQKTKPIKPIPPKPAAAPAGEPPKKQLSSPDGEILPDDYKPRLPGVFDAETGADLIPSLKKTRARDPETGQFVKGEGEGEERPTLPEGVEPGQEPPEKPELPADQEPGKESPPPAKIKFLGKEYKDIAEIEQLHRTLQGVHRSQLEERRKLVDEVDYGYQAGNLWQAAFVEAEARLAQLEKRAPNYRGATATPPVGGAPAAAPSGQPVASPPGVGVELDVDGILSDVDMDAFEMLAMHPRGGLTSAGKYLLAETLRVVKEKLMPAVVAQLDQRLQPIEATGQTRAAQERQLEAVELVASLKTSDGAAAFPELENEAEVAEIGELWGRAGNTELRTPQDIIQAISLYRTMRSFIRPAQQAPAGEVPPAPETPAPVAAASLEAEPTGLVPANQGRLHGSPESRRLSAALDKVDLVDPTLGFKRNY